jgi:glycine cleavage system H lipoate-binding protein
MGNLRYAYIVNALRDWIGDEAEIREVGCQYRAINQKGDILTVTGKVIEKKVEDGENRVYLETNGMDLIYKMLAFCDRSGNYLTVFSLK